MAETPRRRRPPQKYPEELRERAVRMVLESIEAAGGERFPTHRASTEPRPVQ